MTISKKDICQNVQVWYRSDNKNVECLFQFQDCSMKKESRSMSESGKATVSSASQHERIFQTLLSKLESQQLSFKFQI